MATDPGATGKPRVTRDVEPSALRDLLDHPPRATVAFVDRGAIDVLPATARVRADRYLFGLVKDGSPDLQDQEVVLVIDGGAYWFELRGISVRGVAARVDPPEPEKGPLAWYAVEPRRVLGWDYGAIREV